MSAEPVTRDGDPVLPKGPITPAPISQLMGELVVDLLETTGLIPEGKFDVLREKAKTTPVVQALIEEGLASSEAIARIVAAQYGLSVVELGSIGIDPLAAETIPLHVLEQVNALPYGFEDGSLCVAISDPQNIHGIDSLRLASRHPIVSARRRRRGDLDRARPARAHRRGVRGLPLVLQQRRRRARGSQRRRRRGRSRARRRHLRRTARPPRQLDHLRGRRGRGERRPLRATEPTPSSCASASTACCTRPSGSPSAARSAYDTPEGAGEARHRRAPEAAGRPDLARRLLRRPDARHPRRHASDGRGRVGRDATARQVEEAADDGGGRTQHPDAEQLAGIIHRPTGALLVTGPTGSGKSTTLFSAMTEINRPEINVITVEDPVEYRLPGLNQVQINPRAGLTFATALRSILRSDPDVVMVGEIRDVETAKISIEAALTGHFVLSTLHTNDAPSALSRLNEMGVEPFLTGAAVTGVLAQRLARRLCEHCKELYTPNKQELDAARIPDELRHGKTELFRRNGCVRCRQTGYRGRIGVFQLLEMNEELSTLAAAESEQGRARAGRIGRRHDDAVGRRDRESRRRTDLARRARPRHHALAPPAASRAGRRAGRTLPGLAN